MNNRGQFSIIAALLISIILVSTVMLTYTVILNDSIQVQPQVLTAIDETNFAIKQILGFSVGYYGSVIRVTGDTSFANQSTLNYTTSGLEYVANTHAEWGAGFSLTNLTIHTYWFNYTSYSTGYLSVTYNLTKLGIYGLQYAPSCGLTVQIANTTQNNQTSLVVTRDQNEPITDLEQQNFQFFQYQTANSTWTLVSPSTSPVAYTNGTYQIQPPAGIDANSYVLQVTDQRGIIVVASPYSSYKMNMTWPSPSPYCYVNNNSSDVDSNGNTGTQLNFTAQQYGPDEINDTLTEASTVSSSFGNPTQSGSGNTSISMNSLYGQAFNSSANAATIYNVTFYGRFSSGTGHVKAVLALMSNLSIVANGVGSVVSINTTAGWYTSTFSTPSAISPSTSYVLMIIPDTSSFLLYYTSTTGGGEYYDTSNNYSSPTNPTDAITGTHQYSMYSNCSLSVDYRLDIEEQWTNVNYNGTNKELDIFMGPFSNPTEPLSVQWWNTSGSSWLTIIPSLTVNGWNNVSVTTYLTSPTFTIRFLDGTQTGDSIQNSWQIDATLLHIDTNNTLSNVRDTITIELLQNGTMRWLGQNLQLSTQTNQTMPIPPLPVRSIHVNQTINGVDSEVPFQIEDWASNYLIPLGMTSNSSVFGDGNMIVFLANNNVSKVTIWWNGSDLATQTSLAYNDKYFTQDDTTDGILSNGNLKLLFPTVYLYVDGFDSTFHNWKTNGASPYLNGAQNNYIYDNVNNDKEAWFTFQDLPTTYSQLFGSLDQGIGASVSIDFNCYSSGDDYFNFSISNGTTTYGPYTIRPPTYTSTYGWRSYDISNIVNTLRKVNNAIVSITYVQAGSTASNVYISGCRLSLNFWLTSVCGNSTASADFMRINNDASVYGASPAYIISNGVVRDIVQQEAEWNNGPTNCPNVYSHIVLTLPANATYYTYELRALFVQSQQSRNITDLCPIEIQSLITQSQTENGTAGGYPIVSNATGTFYNQPTFSAHHWSQLISGTNGAGIMFTDAGNSQLYSFDSLAGTPTGGLRVNAAAGTIELHPVEMAPANFTYALNTMWTGAVSTFSNTTPIYQTASGQVSGSWASVEYPPTVSVYTGH